MNDTGFNTGSFILDTYPDSLDKLLNELRDIAEGRGILPASLENKLPPRSRISPSAFDHDEATRSKTEETASFLPPFDWVKGIMKRAEECRVNRECETSWNGEIHAPILQSVFRKSQFTSDGPVDFRWPQAAQIITEYRPEEAPSKMIDFCVFYRPDKGSNVEQAINGLCRVRPAQSINHTDLGDLCTRPVALSIETKRPGVEGDNAELQIGTWHSAQWRSLRQNRRGCLRSIEFLPGIIVQGHNWQFVASVVDGSGKSLLLTGERIGGTDSPMGIYSLLLALRRLRRWIMDEYWPMFLSDVLDISSQDTPA